MCIIDPMDLCGGDCYRDLQLLAFLLERFRARSEPVCRKKACKFKRLGSVETKVPPPLLFLPSSRAVATLDLIQGTGDLGSR
jgi:hypothetical protein